MQAIRYEAPGSVNDAVRLMQADPEARVLAGGTDLLIQCRSGVRRPTAFIDIKRIPELVDITVDAQGLRMGAATPAADICADEHLRQRWPGRSCRAHRIDADSGTGISRRQPVQCVARSGYPVPVDRQPSSVRHRRTAG